MTTMTLCKPPSMLSLEDPATLPWAWHGPGEEERLGALVDHGAWDCELVDSLFALEGLEDVGVDAPAARPVGSEPGRVLPIPHAARAGDLAPTHVKTDPQAELEPTRALAPRGRVAPATPSAPQAGAAAPVSAPWVAAAPQPWTQAGATWPPPPAWLNYCGSWTTAHAPHAAPAPHVAEAHPAGWGVSPQGAPCAASSAGPFVAAAHAKLAGEPPHPSADSASPSTGFCASHKPGFEATAPPPSAAPGASPLSAAPGSLSYAPMTPAGSCAPLAPAPSALPPTLAPHGVAQPQQPLGVPSAAFSGSLGACAGPVRAAAPLVGAAQPPRAHHLVAPYPQPHPYHPSGGGGSPLAPCSPHGVEGCPPSTLCYAYVARPLHEAAGCGAPTRATSPHTPGTSRQVAPRVGSATSFGSVPGDDRYAAACSASPCYAGVDAQGAARHGAASSSSGADGAAQGARRAPGAPSSSAGRAGSPPAAPAAPGAAVSAVAARPGEFVVPPRAVGQERIAKIERYRRKRANRLSPDVVRYQCRRTHAQSRPRIHGRFFTVKKDDE